MKKVLFLGRFAPPMHGAAKMNDLYFNALKKDRSFSVKKIKLNKYNSLENIGKIDKSKIKGYIQTINELISKIKKFNPEIIYLEMAPKGIAFYKDSIFVLISKLFKKKIFIQFHAKGISQTTKNKLAALYYKSVFKNTKIIILSKILFNDIKNVAKWKQIKILPNGIPDEINDNEFEKIIKRRDKNKKPIFLFLSNMIESKGPIDVLKICNKLNIKGVDFECNFIGKFQDADFKKKFEKQLKIFKLEKKCKYLGAKYGKNKNKILEKSDLLIYPTTEDCFPLVILEAFMFGIPVFSYNTGAIKEMISEKDIGVVMNQKDWKGLFKEIKKNKKYNPKIIRRKFQKHFYISNTIKKLKRILK